MGNYINRIINKFIIIEDGYKLEISEKKREFKRYDLSFEKLLLSDLELLMKVYGEELGDKKYCILKDRINEEDIDIFCIKNKSNDILGYFCMAYKSVKENGINHIIDIDDKSVYLFDDYVFAKHRGNGIQHYSILSRLKLAMNKNKKYAIVNVYSWNISSIKNYTKLGFKKYIRYYYLKIIRKIIIKNIML
ncbi:MAG: hypothetical protein SOY04_07670 [Clostridium celatum]|nr:hypothetical protein [Clostridium celatum]